MSDPDLARRLGDATSHQFADWVRPHWPAMAGLARRSATESDWEDALQEALASAWRKRAQFDPDRGTARNWLLAITADQVRKSYRRVRPLPLPPDLNVASAATDRNSRLDVERAIAALSPRQQLAVNLHYFLGLPIADLAVVMNCSPGTAKSTLSDARRRIRTQLGEDY